MPENAANSAYEVLDVETAREVVREYVEESQKIGADAIVENAATVANAAADSAAGSVAQQVADNVSSLGTTVVMLDGDQWAYIQGAIKGAAGGSFVGLLLLAMVLGAVVSTIIVKGWRHAA